MMAGGCHCRYGCVSWAPGEVGGGLQQGRSWVLCTQVRPCMSAMDGAGRMPLHVSSLLCECSGLRGVCECDAALQQQYGVVTELRSKIKGSGLDDGRRMSLQVRLLGWLVRADDKCWVLRLWNREGLAGWQGCIPSGHDRPPGQCHGITNLGFCRG